MHASGIVTGAPLKIYAALIGRTCLLTTVNLKQVSFLMILKTGDSLFFGFTTSSHQGLWFVKRTDHRPGASPLDLDDLLVPSQVFLAVDEYQFVRWRPPTPAPALFFFFFYRQGPAQQSGVDLAGDLFL